MSVEKTEELKGERPLIAVSRCLLGDAVRYDGGSRPFPWLTEVLSVHCDLLPICPEVEAGLEVPRPPVRLVETAGALRALGVDDPTLDVSAAIERSSAARVAELERVDGLILKARSPSCGLQDVPRYDPAGRETGRGPGLFSRAAVAAWPALPAADEGVLATEVARVAFLLRVFRYRCRRQGRQG